MRALPFAERRRRLEALVARLDDPRIDLSPMVPFATWEDLAAARADPASVGAGPDADAIEGCMVKRADSPYLPGRPKGYWYKWKRDPFLVDAVMMYGQRGTGSARRSIPTTPSGSGARGRTATSWCPVGKAYHGFTDEELVRLDRYVRNHTVNRFGPVREVEYGKDRGLVLEVAFEGLQRSTRHKSGVAMRFPRINRIRWDKPPAEADRIETLEKILERGEKEVYPLRRTIMKVDTLRWAGMTDGDEAAGFPVRNRIAGGRQAAPRLVAFDTRPGLHRDHRCRGALGRSSRRAADGLLPPHLGLPGDPGERRPGCPPGPAGRLRPAGAPERRYVHMTEGRTTCPPISGRPVRRGSQHPAVGGQMVLGTWQGIYLVEHRDRPPARRYPSARGGPP